MIEYILTGAGGSETPGKGAIADLVLDADLIPRCGLVPPFRVLRKLLAAGISKSPLNRGCKWAPLDLSEEDYWETAESLASMTPDMLHFRDRRPRIFGEIRPDYDAPDTENFTEWLTSLAERGHSVDPYRPRCHA